MRLKRAENHHGPRLRPETHLRHSPRGSPPRTIDRLVSGLRRSSASAAGRSRAAALLGGQIPAVFSRLATCGAGACAPSMQRFRRRDTSGRQRDRVVPLRKGNLVWGVTRGPGACATDSKIGSCIEPIRQVKIQRGIKRKCDGTSRERTPQPGSRPRGGSSTVRNHYAVTRSPAGAQSLRCHTNPIRRVVFAAIFLSGSS